MPRTVRSQRAHEPQTLREREQTPVIPFDITGEVLVGGADCAAAAAPGEGRGGGGGVRRTAIRPRPARDEPVLMASSPSWWRRFPVNAIPYDILPRRRGSPRSRS